MLEPPSLVLLLLPSCDLLVALWRRRHHAIPDPLANFVGVLGVGRVAVVLVAELWVVGVPKQRELCDSP